MLTAALENAQVSWSDITPVYLAPADAASAFSRGSVDAWSIWDPFYAVAELRQKARPLPIDPRALQQNSLFLANSSFVAQHPEIVSAINATIAAATASGGDQPGAAFVETSVGDIEAPTA